ncbi:hypothetical protein VIGAN_04252900 [Vigna angularis var. angularis]|uniref:Uncharacterized protein n=1 Tax=Vigna angularis var. angularis TaxID=157739 RepID=A0A0S3RWR7_PHAAN|nr:hypothetical protein VIGAN_04252900 [Vigna angularis var. angularis]
MISEFYMMWKCSQVAERFEIGGFHFQFWQFEFGALGEREKRRLRESGNPRARVSSESVFLGPVPPTTHEFCRSPSSSDHPGVPPESVIVRPGTSSAGVRVGALGEREEKVEREREP